MTFQFLNVERCDDGVAIVTLNRPEKRNALSIELMRELDAAFVTLGDDRSVRAIVLAANGPAFSSGHDLRELHDRDEAAYAQVFETCVTLMERIVAIPQPVIAEVARVATAAGCQLVATCDLAVASTQATFATPGVRIGLFCSTPMVALSRAVGQKRAMEMLLTGEPIDAQTALSWGLVNRVVAPEELRETSLTLARRVADASARVVALGKSAFYEQIDCTRAEAYALASRVMTRNTLVNDAQEGIDAFLAKRAPRWERDESVKSAP